VSLHPGPLAQHKKRVWGRGNKWWDWTQRAATVDTERFETQKESELFEGKQLFKSQTVDAWRRELPVRA
jgi:hypothetical protein